MQPGTYFNPQTEVLVVVDDSTSLDQEVFNMEAYEGADWVRVSDEVPVDEDRRDRCWRASRPATTPARRTPSPRRPSSRATRSRRRREGQDPGREDCRVVLEAGERAPTSRCPTKTATRSALAELKGETVVLYFYPRADTPGCTTQACGVRDHGADYKRPAPA